MTSFFCFSVCVKTRMKNDSAGNMRANESGIARLEPVSFSSVVTRSGMQPMPVALTSYPAPSPVLITESTASSS